jgi:hypothetical protein
MCNNMHYLVCHLFLIFRPGKLLDLFITSSNYIVFRVIRLLVRKPDDERPLGRPRRRWADNIKMDLKRDWMG